MVSAGAYGAAVRLLGIDGCRGGWLVARATLAATGVEVTFNGMDVCAHLADGVPFTETPQGAAGASGGDSWVGTIDMPIGLLDEPTPGGRECDRAARRLLGARRSTVFSPPIRPALDASTYAEAKVRNGGMTIQTWNIVARIAELDALVLPASPVHEAHPELAFLRLSGGEPLPPSAPPTARRCGRALLVDHLAGAASVLGQRPPRGAAADDVCDALVLCLTAARIATSTADRVPDGPVATDARGLPMLVWW